jgi:hypothetical protein
MDYGLTIGITQILQVYTAPSYAHTELCVYNRERVCTRVNLKHVYPRQESRATVRNRKRG